MESARALYKKLKIDKGFRQIFIVFVCCCGTFVVLGWNLEQAGPTLLDLQILARCSLEEASLFLTATALGYLVSVFVASVTLDRFDRYLHLVFANIGVSTVMAVIPWSKYFNLMCIMHILKGLCCGFVEAVVCTLLMHFLGNDCRTYIQVINLCYTIGGIASPLASAPFLTPVDGNDIIETVSHSQLPTNLTSTQLQNETMDIGENTDLNLSVLFYTTTSVLTIPENDTTIPALNAITNVSGDTNNQIVTDVYKAYSISSGLSFLSAITFLMLYMKVKKELKAAASNGSSDKIHEIDFLPLKLRLPVCVVLFMTAAIYSALEQSFAGLVATFAVKQFKWTKYLASYVTSFFWGFYFVGSLLGIFIAPLFRISKFLGFYSLMILLSFVCLLITTLNAIDVGIWITAGMSGFFMSVIYPLLFAWTEEEFMHVSARVTALLLVSTNLGVMLNPIFLGQMMQESLLWFVYILFAESFILNGLFVIGMLLSRQTRKYRKDSKLEIENNQPSIQTTYINDASEVTFF